MQAHPLYQALTPRPGIGVRTAAVFLAEPLSKTFDTGAQLASYAGLAPVTHRSGSSIRGEVRLPRRQQEAQARHVPVRLRLTALRLDCWGFFGQCLFCASGCLLQVQEIAFDLVRGAIP